MPRKHNIRWRESDAEKLTNEIKRFNAKISRVKRSHPELADILPDTIKKADKLKMIEEFKQNPRSEFKKTLNSLDRFSNKGAEKAVTNKQGLTTTKWKKKEISIMTQQLNRDRTKERNRVEQIEVTSRGEPVGMKRGEMGSVRMNELNPKTFNFDNIRSPKELDKFEQSVKKQTSAKAKDKIMENYRLNYIKSIYRVYGDQGEELISIIKQLSDELVTETYYKEQEADITHNYTKAENDAKFAIIEKIWKEVADKNIDQLNRSFNPNWNSRLETELNDWYEKGW